MQDLAIKKICNDLASITLALQPRRTQAMRKGHCSCAEGLTHLWLAGIRELCHVQDVEAVGHLPLSCWHP